MEGVSADSMDRVSAGSMDSVSAGSMDSVSAGSNGSVSVSLNAADVILANAPRLADRPAIFHADGAMNYGELADQAARAAVALAALGVTRGDRVGLLLNDSPLAGVETKRLDRAGQPVTADEPGILWVRHPSLATGYIHPEATEKAFRDGWFCTNDLCTVDAEGFLYHEGRADKLLKVAGQWVKPSEIEDAALADESIRDAACVVVTDSDGFERLALFVVPAHATPAVVSEQTSDSANALTLESECLRSVGRQIAASLPRHSQPKWIRSIVELPRTPTGKVQGFLLRDRLRAEWQSG